MAGRAGGAKPPADQRSGTSAPTLFDGVYDDGAIGPSGETARTGDYTPEQRDALKTIASNLLELREMLRRPQV